MNTLEENDDAMTASFSASTFEAENNDPWTPASQEPSSGDVGAILVGIPLPAIYTTAFDLAQPSGGKISVSAMNKILSVSGLSPSVLDKILNMAVPPTRSRITKTECSAALALVALAQRNMDVTIANLVAHRQDLPAPRLPGFESIDFSSSQATYSTDSSIPKHHPINVGSSISDPWRNSTFNKGNGFPHAQLASPPIEQSAHSGLGEATDEPPELDAHLWFLNLDTIRMSFAPEKEGIFIFKHTNYVVESKNHRCTVIRRYSDFCFLVDILEKRYPFRMLPQLPPKRLGASLVADETFLGRRLRGLTRFMNALVRHPVLRDDPLVVSFLTEPVELATWRKNAVISTEEEFVSRLPMSAALERQIPADLELQLELIKHRLPGSVEYYRGMVHVMDRIQKRTEANAADYTRFSLALNALADCEKQCHIEECYSCGQLSQGYNKIGSHISQSSLLLEEQGNAIQRGMVEDLKRHRDLLVSLMELLQRRDRNNFFSLTQTLKKRIEANEIKLKNARTSVTSGPPDVDPGQFESMIEKLTASIAADHDELKTQEQRSILLQHTLWTEIMYYHKNQAQVAIMYQNFVREQIKTSQSLMDNWSSLSPLVHDLPMETNGFN
ncbi:Sorting nexin mvp1 [Podila clonocystis]|nr:Sorting nexin mvp1 [Podila clonocystis]